MERDIMENIGTPEAPFYVADLKICELFIGPFPEAEAERSKIIKGLAPFFKCAYNSTIFHLVEKYLVISITERIRKAYHAGKIRPELCALLEMDLPPYKKTDNPLKDWRELAAGMIQTGKADFSPFKGPQDTGENWLFKYHIAPLVLPYFEQNIKGMEAGLKDLKAETRQTLKAYLNAAIDTEPVTQRQPLTERILKQYAKALNALHAARNGSEAELHFVNWPPVDFYLNPETGQIIDLRPYKEEVKDLIAPISWDYIKAYTADILAILAERKRKRPKQETPPPSIFENDFIKMFNAPPTNNIIAINTAKPGRGKTGGTDNGYFEQNMFTQEWEYKEGGTEINMPVKQEAGNAMLPLFSTSTWKTMHFISLLFTAHNSKKGAGHITPVVETTVREFMDATGRKITANSVKDTTKVLKKDLETLNEMKLKYTDKKYSLDLVRPFPRVHLQRGKIRVTLEQDFANFLVKTTGFLMNYPAALLKLKENNSSLFPLGYKMALNRSNDTNIRKGKANILSVAICLESCPGIPRIEDVKKHRGSPVQKIIEPFEKVLDELQKQGLLERWEYCLPKGEPLKEADVKKYEYFISLYILYEIKNFPISSELERIKAAEEKRQKKQKRIERLTERNIARGRAKRQLEEETKKEG